MSWKKLGGWFQNALRFLGNLYALLVMLVLGAVAVAVLFFLLPAANNADAQTRGVLGLIGLVLFGAFLARVAGLIGPDLLLIYEKVRNRDAADGPIVTRADGSIRPLDEG